MEKIENRAIIKFFVLKGLPATEIHAEMVNVLRESAPSLATVTRWVNEFKHGRTSIEDVPRRGRPKSAAVPQTNIIQQVYNQISDERGVKVREIAEAIEISEERIRHILYEELQMKKLFARWVPNSLTVDEKYFRLRMSRSCLERFQKNKIDFVRRFITTNECWVYHYEPESDCLNLNKAKADQLAKKVRASVFWDAKGILLIDYLPKHRKMTAEHYVSLLDHLNEKIHEKRPGLQKKKIIFHQQNTRAHEAPMVMAKILGLNFELLENPQYSPDLDPSDFYLFPNLKKYLCGKRFSTNKDMIAAVDEYFAGLPDSHYRDGINLLEKRWTKCNEVRGEYLEE